MDVADQRCSSHKLQEVLSVRLPYFYRCALRVLGNAADAEDAVQEAVLAAYKNINQFRGEAHISTWLTAIVRNCADALAQTNTTDSSAFGRNRRKP